ncbi:MAG: hypothetical protein MSG64_10820 [Pyrinomonadaceae bacterium MAG19_C2-C3]|nr:hypothetical protein [Pyrinomonadaceae bacterium MAG19_C2-C3]
MASHRLSSPLSRALRACFIVGIIFTVYHSDARAGASETTRGKRRQNQTADDAPNKRLGVRLRSFVNTATASLNFEPTEDGGLVRLTALNLPTPSVVSPAAGTYVIWAAAPGGARRVGLLPVDAQGNGGLEFARPEGLESYSVLVTAEATPEAVRPGGAVVFASRAGEVTAFFATVEERLQEARRRRRRPEPMPKRRVRRTTDFYTEVDDAVARKNGGRTLVLIGEPLTPNANGEAHANVLGEQSYVRARIKRLPPSTSVGATAYVLWGTEPAGRIVYMGSVPETATQDTEIYVRTGGAPAPDFKLSITAEARRLVSSPSTQRAMSSREKR